VHLEYQEFLPMKSFSKFGLFAPAHLSEISNKEKTMKTRKSKFLLIALLVVTALVLSACQVNFITDIKDNGSGVYTQEIGFQADEASMAGLDTSGENFCADQNQELPPGTTIREETRNGDETWCIFETSFATLEDLKTIYATTDMTINDISMTDGKLSYDVSLDLSTDTSGMATGASIYWTVTMPGSVIETNATERDGSTLKWTLVSGQVNNMRAVSNTGGLDLGGDTLWYIIGAAALCLCLIVIIVVVVVVILLVRRNKKKAASAGQPVGSAVETPAP
jgi:hypothetical protein